MRRNAARLRIVSDANRINPIEGLLIDGRVRHYGDARHAATLLQNALDRGGAYFAAIRLAMSHIIVTPRLTFSTDIRSLFP